MFLQEIRQTDQIDIYGEYLINAQGEDVVAGTRTPQYITKKAKEDAKAKARLDGRDYAKSLFGTNKILKS